MKPSTPKGDMKPVYVVNYSEWDEYVNDLYPDAGYEFAADAECGNDTDHYFPYYPTLMEPSEYDRAHLDRFAKGEHVGRITGTLIRDLIRREVLSAANYLIRVSW